MSGTYYDYLKAQEGSVPFEKAPDQKSASVGSSPPPPPARPVRLKIKKSASGRAAGAA